MEGKEENIPNGEWNNTNPGDEETSEDRTISDNKSSLVSDEQEIEVDDIEVQPSTSTGRLSSSQRRRMRKKKTPAESNEIWRQFYNLRRGRPGHVTPSEVLDEVAGDKNIDQRLNGWKLTLLADQMDAISDIETRNIEMLSEMLVRNNAMCFAAAVAAAAADDDDDTYDTEDSDDVTAGDHRRQYHEMIEQCKMVRDKMQMARMLMMRVLDHKPNATAIVESAIAEERQRRRDEGDYS